ncbi:MAG: multicopper oxidase family protein [Pseudorhodoplanes sp.]
MRSRKPPHPSRREILSAVAGLAGAALLPRAVRGAPAMREVTLVAAPARVALVEAPHPDTEVWAYNGVLPGPAIRVRQGERLRVRVENRLAEETTVHWHGLRVPNAMDGVPHLTQQPIAPGGSFLYEFDCPDAGTYWYHPHQRSHEQVGRGLAGALIVEEATPPDVDRDVTWVLGDWRLLKDASISGDFGHMRDISHNGRIGNTVTVNGRVRESFPVRAGERIRLRLINAANARIFGLGFGGHAPLIVARDGQPVAPYEPEGGQVVLGPAARVDLVLDMTGKPGERFAVVDSFYSTQHYRLIDLAYGGEAQVPRKPGADFARLARNPLAEPDLAQAERHDVILGGGMMGQMHSAMMHGRQTDMRTLMRNGLIWAINGVAAAGHVLEPVLTCARGRSYVLRLVNETAWHHPMHLHGHFFRVLAVNGRPTAQREWLDTVMVNPREEVEIAFVADNPGSWMFHCHILEHQAGGMMSVVRVA